MKTKKSAARSLSVAIVRPLLWLPMAVFEIALLLLCWALAFAHRPTASRLFTFAQRLPGKSWYWPNKVISTNPQP